MDYERYRGIARRLIPKYGTVGTLTETKSIIPDPTKPWNATVAEVDTSIHLLSFPDDGVLFVDHNVTGDVRILLVAPKPELQRVTIGAKITFGVTSLLVKKYKAIDPDGSGVILWALLAA